MLRLGLTGGIASGKSAVAGMLHELGFPVIDADSVAHSLIEPGQPAYQEVVSKFGSSILDASGRIDRSKLGALVFADRTKLDALNAIVHPRVRTAIAAQFAEWAKDGARKAAFVEAALLVEAGYLTELDGLVVAWCRPEQQIERLCARGMSDEQARRRIASQMSVEEKLKFATETIDCSGSIEDTRRQVESLAAKINARA